MNNQNGQDVGGQPPVQQQNPFGQPSTTTPLPMGGATPQPAPQYGVPTTSPQPKKPFPVKLVAVIVGIVLLIGVIIAIVLSLGSGSSSGNGGGSGGGMFGGRSEFIQNITNENCPLERTMVTDARDNRTYWVRKIPNSGTEGKDLCWMETNLAYTGGGDNQFGDTMDLTEHFEGSVMGNDTPHWIAPALTRGGVHYTVFPTPPSLARGSEKAEDAEARGAGSLGAQYGFLYNWCAAMGGNLRLVVLPI